MGLLSLYIVEREGVTQGDPLSMFFYAVAMLPLIRSLSEANSWTQIWYADDSACAAKLANLRVWFDRLRELGPDFGYHPEPSKSYLIVHPTDMSQAQEIFGDSGVQIVSGHRFLGGYVGDPVGSMEFVQSEVETWVHCIECLAQAADSSSGCSCCSISLTTI